ncbi:MAG: hypothetical protein R2784_13790 [Saprospiraceae bacterium]
MKNWTGKKTWADPGKTRNLINAFADVYQENYFDGDTFSIFRVSIKSSFSTQLNFMTDLLSDSKLRVFGNNSSEYPKRQVRVPGWVILLHGILLLSNGI